MTARRLLPVPVAAAQVRAGDVLLYDGETIEVMTCPAGAVFCRHGRRTTGLAIDCRAPSMHPDGTAVWTLFRRGTDIVYLVRPTVP